jgi:tripartite-type tricarboxylate transporter receptor subunit TctC
MLKAFTLSATIATALTLLNPAGSFAEEPWPERPVRIVSPTAPGGVGEQLGRLIAQQLGESLRQNFVVENRPGAGGFIGAEIVARAAPDGYTFLISSIASHVLAPAMSPTPPVDAMKDFTHVVLLGGPPSILVVNATLPINSLRDFLDYAKARREPVSYGSPGVGTLGHLAGELFKQTTGATLEHIPYRGPAFALTDLMGNQIPMAMLTLTTASEQVRTGKLRALAMTTRSRLPDWPNLPTFTELGYPNLTATTWFAFSGPARLPDVIAGKLNAEVIRILALPVVRERLRRDAIDPEPLLPGAVTAFIQAEIDRWAPIVRASGAKLE